MARAAEKTLHAHRPSKHPVLRALFTVLRVTALLFAVTVVGVVAGTIASIAPGLPDTEGLDSWVPNQATRIYSSDNKLLARLYVENREFVPITEIPEHLQQATVAIEDARFFNHIGADPKALLRAVVNNIRNKDVYGQGGSTITEQLAKNLFLNQQKTFSRRLQQMMLALKIERRYSKEEILEMYLNEVCYGSGAFGVQAASKLYFHKPACELTLAEAALLAGLPRRPSFYSPFENPDAAKARQELVLHKMVAQGDLTTEEAETAIREKLNIAPRKNLGEARIEYPYFTTYAIRELVARYGVDMIYKGGLAVYTTLNTEVQRAAEEAIHEGLKDRSNRNVTQGALVCIKTSDGSLLAIVGGRSYRESQWNRATQSRRQPGSSFKPYLYAAAMENGFTPNSVIRDSPVSYPGAGGHPWRPKNYDGKYRGSITLRRALATSVNVVAVKLMEQVGVDKVIETARRMGISSPLDPYLPLALGASGITLLEHAGAYCAFATGGLRVEPTTILRVLDHTGRPIDSLVPRVQRVLNPQTAEAVRSMLLTAVESGTGRNARIPNYQVAGKTGTTSGGKDAWFMGFTPDLTCGIWMGNDHNERMYRPSGGFFCAPVWKKFMVRALTITKSQRRRFDANSEKVKETRERGEEKTRTLRLCTESGMLATANCPSAYQEKFARGKGPKDYCDLHPAGTEDGEEVTVCSESGQLATENCPSPSVRTVRMGTAPKSYCTIHRASEPTERHPSETTKPSAPPADHNTTPALPPPVTPDEGAPE